MDARLGRPRPRGERRRRERAPADVRGDRRRARHRSSPSSTATRSAAASGSSPCADIVIADPASGVRVLRGQARDRPRGDLAVRAPQDRRERRAALLRDRRALRRGDGAADRARARGGRRSATARSTGCSASSAPQAHARLAMRSGSCSSGPTAPRPRAGSRSGGRARRARRACAPSSTGGARTGPRRRSGRVTRAASAGQIDLGDAAVGREALDPVARVQAGAWTCEDHA